MKKGLFVAALTLVSTAPAQAETIVATQVTIRVNDGDKILEYYPFDDGSLLLRARDGNKWYDAMLPPSCSGITRALGTAPGVTIESARPDGEIGRGSVLKVGNVVCQIRGIIESSDPRARGKK